MGKFAELVRRAVRNGVINPARDDLGLVPEPGQCQTVICGGKASPDSQLCHACDMRFRTAVQGMIKDIEDGSATY